MSRAAHIPRPASNPGAARLKIKWSTAPASEFPPGFFTALIREHNWPPNWRSQAGESEQARLERLRGEAGRMARWVAAQEGKGWGTGTVVMPGTPGHLAPGWMGKANGR